MSKGCKLSKLTSTSDGNFEMPTFHRRSKLKLMSILIRSSTTGLDVDNVTKYTYKTITPTLVQLDGEVTSIDTDFDVRVGIEPRKLAYNV